MGKHQHNCHLVAFWNCSLFNVYLARYTRQGTPTPVVPDFSNLKAQWATVSPSIVALSPYSAASVTPRPCPSSSAGGWVVDPILPLPTIGQVGTEAPGGAASAPNPTAPHPTPVTITSEASQGATGSATSTTARGIAGRVESSVRFLAVEGSLSSCILALLTVGLAVLLLL